MEIIKISPRFGILLLAMCFSLAFIILDCLSVTSIIQHALPDGLNPFWKLAFVFKCFTDTIILDDFRTALDKLKQYRLGQINSTANMSAIDRFPISAGGRRPTEYAPWNESRGVTKEDREKAEPILPDVDLENQLHYWSRPNTVLSNASRSTTTK
jgi:hypothetical protein